MYENLYNSYAQLYKMVHYVNIYLLNFIIKVYTHYTCWDYYTLS